MRSLVRAEHVVFGGYKRARIFNHISNGKLSTVKSRIEGTNFSVQMKLGTGSEVQVGERKMILLSLF